MSLFAGSLICIKHLLPVFPYLIFRELAFVKLAFDWALLSWIAIQFHAQ